MSDYLVSNNKTITKNALFLYLRMFFIMAVSLYTVRVVIKTLSVSDYGLYGAVGGVILTFGFITGVLTHASQRFFSVELGKGEKGRVQEVFSTLFLTYIGVVFLVVLLAETVGVWFLLNKMTITEGREGAAMWVFQFSLLSFVYALLSSPFQALIIAHERMSLYAYVSIMDAILKLVIVYLLLLFDFDKLKLYAVLIFVSHFITNTIYIAYCKKKYNETKLKLKVDKTTFKEVFSYSSWTLLGTIAGMCNTQGMNLLLNVFWGPVANAAYLVANQVYSTVGLFATNFYTAVKPPLIKNYASGNYDYVQKLFVFSSKMLFILLFILVLPLITCTESILSIWLGQVGDYMIAFVRLTLVYVTIMIVSYPITAVVQAGGFVKLYHTLVDGFSIFTLPIVYVLFKIGFGAEWAYFISIAIFTIAHFLRIYVLKRVFPAFEVSAYLEHFFLPSVLLFVVLYLTFDYFSTYWNFNIVNTIIYCAICCTCAFVCGMIFILSRTERRMILNMINLRKLNK